MAWVDEQLSAQFGKWEQRGRGWRVWSEPVIPEPPFKVFPGHYLPAAPIADDGRRPTALSSFVRSLARTLKPEPPPLPPEHVEEEESEAESLVRGELVELQASLPPKLNASSEAFAHFLDSLAYLREPVGFELLGLPESIITQFVTHPADAASVQRQLQAHFPDAVFMRKERVLATAWDALADTETAIVEFGLAREFVLPLATNTPDLLIGLTAALASLQPGELGLFQVLFQPVRHAWADSSLRAVSDVEGKPAFVNAPELLAQGKRKVSQPLFAAVVRIAVRSDERPWEIARELASALSGLADLQGNELIPLRNDDYPFDDHVEDVRRRQSRRSGMVLNRDELLGFVHLPTSAVRSAKLRRELTKTRPVPKAALAGGGLLLGINEHAGQTTEVRLTTEQRVRHSHIIGASGTGKSTLLFNLIRQDIENGEGVAVLDPHGDLVDRILGIIPAHRIGDVVLVDPSDEQYSVGFNILSAHSDLEKNLLSSDLVSVFQRLSTSWGDQMGSVLSNAILAFLESERGGTLADLRRFLIEPAFRAKFLVTVSDPDIVYYWQKGFPQLSGNKSIGPVLTRLDTFLSPKPIRYMVSQRENRLDFAHILDTGKIFLAKLPQGQMGKENAFLLGSLLVAKFQQLAMSRQAQQVAVRKDFWLYVDEFQNFITPSMAEILSGARKYRLGLILAHQELRQLERDREVASAVLSNPYTRVVFRVGDADAKTLESGFANFEARDLQNLGTGEAICRLERSDGDFNLRVPLPEEPDADAAEAVRKAVITASRAKYATPRADIEAALRAKLAAEEPEPAPAKARPTPPSVPKAAEPKSAEAPKVTVTEPATVATPAAAPEVAPAKPAQVEQRQPAAPPDLGRGGAQHKAIQQRVKAEAERLGFHATIEQAIANGSVDVLLTRAVYVIACEISVTTTIDHEVGNVQKCLRAGYDHVAVICQEASRLEKIQAAVQSSLGQEVWSNVRYFTPDEFLTQLAEVAAVTFPSTSQPVSESQTVRRGYQVKRKSAALSPEERQSREQAGITQMASVMKRGKKS
ncbi:MAG: type IV secretion system DNA-binding domain-containing protein [Limisphaerales bacterium]